MLKHRNLPPAPAPVNDLLGNHVFIMVFWWSLALLFSSPVLLFYSYNIDFMNDSPAPVVPQSQPQAQVNPAGNNDVFGSFSSASGAVPQSQAEDVFGGFATAPQQPQVWLHLFPVWFHLFPVF